ncbi:MAG: zinc ribbon domain-containing protein [Candidatus Omnitrophica bacterium]|nr:zinc ribbon domain-containing protein [Candidatus Omnitrophota bacterium]MBU1996247.1 zinc ribbon domain-containing protein [Candidatus Omnitrophota bacterium]MBU4334001.1 zinc ribbon domain-containing protein [Candidatus Omnitrophota bacterium]
MPTYQYECEACGYEFEKLQSMLDQKLKKCPECGKNELQRLIGAGSGIIFKGNGFYETDYKKSNVSNSSGSKNVEPGKKTPDDSSGCAGSDCCANCPQAK